MTSLHLHCDLHAPKEIVFQSWLNQFQQGAITQALCYITPEVRGRIELWNGAVIGKFLQIEKNKQLVLTWRTVEFEEKTPDTHLILLFKDTADGSRFIVQHENIPLDMLPQFRFAWEQVYFPNIKSFFSS
jgi:activator of HSP90 ATPase